jgi:hypothetical protein
VFLFCSRNNIKDGDRHSWSLEESERLREDKTKSRKVALVEDWGRPQNPGKRFSRIERESGTHKALRSSSENTPQA